MERLLAERHLAAAVALLTAERELSRGERDEAARAIEALAESYRAERRGQAERAREWRVSADLAQIEDACAALAATFDGASQAAYDVLHGHGSGGRPAGFPDLSQARRYVGLRALAGRYHVPLAPPDTLAVLSEVLARPAGFDPIRAAASLDWPTAVAALGLAVRERREAFETGHRAETERFNAILHYGPGHILKPAPRRGASERATKRMRRNDPGLAPDQGGQQNMHNSMRGAPGWHLARECYECLAIHRPEERLSGARGGLFYAFTLKVHAFATLQDLEEVETPGDAFDAGLGHHIQVAVKLLPALAAINTRQGSPDPFRPLTTEEHAQKVSLELAVLVGRVPAWMA